MVDTGYRVIVMYVLHSLLSLCGSCIFIGVKLWSYLNCIMLCMFLVSNYFLTYMLVSHHYDII